MSNAIPRPRTPVSRLTGVLLTPPNSAQSTPTMAIKPSKAAIEAFNPALFGPELSVSTRHEDSSHKVRSSGPVSCAQDDSIHQIEHCDKDTPSESSRVDEDAQSIQSSFGDSQASWTSDVKPSQIDGGTLLSLTGDASPGMQSEVDHWINATRDAVSTSCSPCTSHSRLNETLMDASPSILLSHDPLEAGSSRTTTARILELIRILQDQETDIEFEQPTVTDFIDHDLIAYAAATDTSGKINSSKCTRTSGSSANSSQTKRSTEPSVRNFDKEDDNESPSKRSNRGPDAFSHTAIPQGSDTVQMPCPLLESSRCHGTNVTISELLRSLQNRHRIAICKDCCTQLSISPQDKKAEHVLKKHASEGCEPRCIARTCQSNTDDDALHHRRTENCPSWKALPISERWTFIWTLVNPGKVPPTSEFPVGLGFEHSTERQQLKRRPRARGLDLCADIFRDVEAQDRKIFTLERDLAESADRNVQLQQRFDEKTVNLENIIETLLENLIDRNMTIPKSLQKRLHRECPRIMNEVELSCTPVLPAKPLTPDSTPKDIPKTFPITPDQTPSKDQTSLSKYRQDYSMPLASPNARAGVSIVAPPFSFNNTLQSSRNATENLNSAIFRSTEEDAWDVASDLPGFDIEMFMNAELDGSI